MQDGGSHAGAAPWGRRGGAGAKKNAPVPCLGRERENASWCHPNSDALGRPFRPSVAGRGPPPSPGPLVALSSPGPGPGAPSTLRPLSVGWRSGYSCAVMAVNAVMLYYFGQKVKGQGTKGSRPAPMTRRQSRSPRDRPWMSISAVATLVAMGTEYLSHRREMYIT